MNLTRRGLFKVAGMAAVGSMVPASVLTASQSSRVILDPREFPDLVLSCDMARFNVAMERASAALAEFADEIAVVGAQMAETTKAFNAMQFGPSPGGLEEPSWD